MLSMQKIEHKFIGDTCELKLFIKQRSNVNNTGLDLGPGRYVQNIRNCDVFINKFAFLIYLDVELYKFNTLRPFDIKNINKVEMNYNTKEHTMLINLPCLPVPEVNDASANSSNIQNYKAINDYMDVRKFKKITNGCSIRVDNAQELLKPEHSYGYGFASKYRGTLQTHGRDLPDVIRIPEPNNLSPLQRRINREIDEVEKFSIELYELDFIELQVDEGQDNPMHFIFDFDDADLTQDELFLLHDLTGDPDLMQMPDEYDIMEIDCSLISILLAICYDIRFTSNEINYESGWTRSTLSATLTYFEPFTSLKDVVISFMRRSLMYTLYRNYELSKKCVKDCISALQSNSMWILKQLLITHENFVTNECSILNQYYIDDYIRYLDNPEICTQSHLQMLANNLKNVLLDIYKKHLGLSLNNIERNLGKVLISDIDANNEEESEDVDFDEEYEDDSDDIDEEGDDEDEDDNSDDDGGDVEDPATYYVDSCESDISGTPKSVVECSSSDTEDDSVIERSMDNLKL